MDFGDLTNILTGSLGGAVFLIVWAYMMVQWLTDGALPFWG
jgi:hypothetical protein